MIRKTITALGIVASVMATVSVAEAGGKHKGRYFGNKHIHGHVWHDYRGYRPAHNCRYYWKKARYTGSPYWYNRYHRCVGHY